MTSRPADRAGTAAAAALLLSWGAAFSLSCGLEDLARPAGAPPPGVLDRLAGSLRADLAMRLYARADKYFHAGGSDHEAPEPRGLLDRWRYDIRPREHRHVEARELAEIMPWLRWATASDPGLVEAWLVSAYWMEAELLRSDLAEAIYREAARRNPRDYRVRLDWGRSLARRGDFDAAVRRLDAAWRMWPKPLDPDDSQAALDAASILELGGFLCLLQGDRAEAAARLRRALDYRPGAEGIARWIGRIESGAPLEDDALPRLREILRAAARSLCDDDHDHGPGCGSDG